MSHTPFRHLDACEWVVCLALREILEWQAMGTPDGFELYADTATVTRDVLARMRRVAEETGDRPLSKRQTMRARAEIATALASLTVDGVLVRDRYGDHRPEEWEFSPLGRDTFEINLARRTSANERPC